MSTKSDFFAAQRYALIGDTSGRKFPSMTLQYLEAQGKTVYTVDLAGATPGALSSVAEVPEDAEAAVIEVAKEGTTDVVQATLDRGIPKIWIHQMTDTPEAVALCKERGVPLETGSCAIMYNAPTSSYHALHRGIWKLLGKY